MGTVEIDFDRLDDMVMKYKVEIKNRAPVVKVEIRPDLVLLNRAAARAMAFLKTMGVACDRNQEQEVKPSWGAECLKIIHLASGSVLADYNAPRGWHMYRDVWPSALPNVCVRKAAQFFSVYVLVLR